MKIERLLDRTEQQKRRTQAHHLRPSDVPQTALFSRTIPPARDHVAGGAPPTMATRSWPSESESVLSARLTQQHMKPALSHAAARPGHQPTEIRSGSSERWSAPVQLALQDTEGPDDACQMGFNTCHQYAARLYDLGYVTDSNILYRNCRASNAECLANEEKVQNDPRVRAGWTSFPPEKERNGGGTVWHEKGSKPIYIPPSFDPLAGIPRKE